MRKIKALLFFVLCMFMVHVHAEPVTQPDPASTYYIMHSSGYLFSLAGKKANLQLPDASHVYTFEAVADADGYYNVVGEKYSLYGSSAANDKAANKAKTMSRYQILSVGDGDFVKLQNMDGNYLKIKEEAAVGTTFDFTKEEPGEAGYWKIILSTDNPVFSEFFSKYIKEAEALKEAAVVGEEEGQYKQIYIDEFAAAIATAKAAPLTTQEEVNAATLILQHAIDDFKDAANKKVSFSTVVTAGEGYYWGSLTNVNAQANYDEASNAVNILTDGTYPAKMWEFVRIGDTDKYVIKVQGAEQAVCLINAEGVYSVGVATYNKDDAMQQWYIRYDMTSKETDVYPNTDFFHIRPVTVGLQCLAFNGDNLDIQEGPGNNNKHRMTFFAPKGVLGTQLSLSKVVFNDIAPNMIGTEDFQYPQEAYDIFKAAIAKAQGLYDGTSLTADEYKAAADELKLATETFEKAKILPAFTPVAGAAYRISMNKYESKYMTNVDGSAINAAEYAAGNAGQHWTPVAVAGEPNTFFLKNGDLALNYDFTVTAFDATTSPKWLIVYAATDNGLNYFGITESADPTKCMTFSSGKTAAIQDYNAGSSAHQARFTLVNTPDDLSLIALENAIGAAKNTLSNAVVGTTVGLYLQEVYDEFKAYIAACDAWLNENGKTETEIADKVTEVKAKEKEFKGSKIPAIDKSALLNLLKEAKTELAAAVVGVEVGQYFQTQIDAMEKIIPEYEEKAKKVTKQADYDKLLADFQAIVAAFAGHTEVQLVKTVLDDAIVSAEALYNELKDQVGTDKGQRPQEVIDAFKTAIESAKTRAAGTPVIADLESLQDARAAFLNGAVSVDRKVLKEAIAAAEADEFKNMTAGEFNGNYPQEKIDAFTAALATAREAAADMTFTQDQVNVATQTLNDAMKALKESKIVIDFAAIDAAIALAEPLHASVTSIGSGEGQCPQATVDAFKAAIDAAKAIDRVAIKQADVDAAVATLNTAIATFKTALVASTGLQAAIADAQAVLDGATKGMKPGNYPSTACTQLTNAIAAAQAVIDAEQISQQALLDAVVALKAAVEKFNGSVIPAHDLTEINALIAEAEAFIAAQGDNFPTLKIALQKAKDIVADPNNYTKSELKSATSSLEKALKIAQTSGIDENGAAVLSIYTTEGALHIEGIQSQCRITVYTLNGKTVSSAETSETAYTASLAAGSYIIKVQSKDSNVSHVVIVK